jgi:hypothetical protein
MRALRVRDLQIIKKPNIADFAKISLLKITLPLSMLLSRTIKLYMTSVLRKSVEAEGIRPVVRL